MTLIGANVLKDLSKKDLRILQGVEVGMRHAETGLPQLGYQSLEQTIMFLLLGRFLEHWDHSNCREICCKSTLGWKVCLAKTRWKFWHNNP